MKKVVLTIFSAVITVMAIAQAQNPVSWNYEAKKKTADMYDIIITATVDHPWHIYSQNTGKGGVVKEVGKLEKVFDKNFNTNVLFYSDKVEFIQTVKVKSGIKTNLSGTVEYMVCDDSQCLPPVKKSFDLKLQ
jgi:DsbC/DsbD-like thiol-disulfide interchange protein